MTQLRTSAVIALASLPAVAFAQTDQDLAQALANPVSSLISVPFQLNYDQNIGEEDGERFLLNIQPVVPISLNADWNMISRTILPLISQDDAVPGEGSQFGFGDVVQSLFFSPKEVGPSGLVWGIGPVFLVPIATEDTLGGDKWGLGPTAVVLRQQGNFTYGALANHIWSVAGDDDRADVSATFLQPFLTYTTPAATSYFLNTEATYDWKSEEWSVPINAGVNQLLTVGGQRIQLGGGVRYWADPAPGGPEGWGARLNLVFLFPT